MVKKIKVFAIFISLAWLFFIMPGSSAKAQTISVDYSSDTALPPVREILSKLIESLDHPKETQFGILATASASEQSESDARRISLKRALELRSAFIDLGINSNRINVRACGSNKGLGGDHVTVEYADSKEALKLFCASSSESPSLKFNSEIIQAIRSDDLATVERHLSGGGEVHARTAGVRHTGSTLLHHAADTGSLRVAKLLVEHGANTNARDYIYYASPLHRAGLNGHLEMIAFLLDHGARINALNRVGETSLFNAVTYGKHEAARLLLMRGSDINLTKSKNGPPVMATTSIGKLSFQRNPPRNVWSGHENVHPMLEVLIEHGVDLSLRNEKGQTLIDNWAMQTCVMGHSSDPKVTERLLQINAPFTASWIKKALYTGLRNPMTKSTCNKLVSLFSDSIDIAKIDPVNIFAKEMAGFIDLCRLAWNHEIAKDIIRGDNSIRIASINARLYTEVARQHANKQKLPEPIDLPIPAKKRGCGHEILKNSSAFKKQ